MLPRPPRPTLFPYTTLFRSDRAPRATRRRRRSPELVQIRAAGEDGAGAIQARGSGAPSGRDNSSGRDRKSTRLNSSHTVISYAVFCLKKKKKKRQKLRV